MWCVSTIFQIVLLLGAFVLSQSATKDRVIANIAKLIVVFLGLVLSSVSARATDPFPGNLITGMSGSFTDSNTTATGQGGEPVTFGGGNLNTIWYNWNAPASGTATFQTCSNTITTFDTTIKSYTGTTLAGLTTLAANDDACANTTPNAFASLISFPVTAGVNYKIQVDGYASITGTYLLSYNLPPPTVTIANTTNGSETGPTPGVMTVTQSAVSATNTVIAYTLGGTATSGTDYTALSGTVTILAGATTATISIPILDDSLVEGSETATVTLSSVTSGVAILGATVLATNTITDNDVATVSIANITNAAEPATAGTLRLTLTKASSTATTVSYTVSGTAVSGADYTSIATSVVVPANTLTFDISIAPSDDLIVEVSETVIVTLTAATSNALITASGNATNSIADNDVATLTLGTPVVNEATGTATYPVTLSRATATGFTIAAATSSGTATSGSDFTAASPTLTFVGTLNEVQNISVPITDDVLVEGSEDFNITLSALSNNFGGALTFTAGAQLRSIADNDVSTISIANITNAAEPATAGTLRLTLTKASATATTVSYTVAGTATSGTDYTSIGTSVVVPANTLTFDISIAPSDDLIVEGPETVIVTLTAATSNALITASGSATNTIADNDTATLVIGTPSVNEATGTASYPVTLNRATATGFTLAAATTSGTAISGTDFTAASPTLTFVGTLNEVQNISVPITDDALVEGGETFNITLSALSNSFGGALTFTAGAQSRLIVDNDAATVSIANTTNGTETGPAAGTLTVTQSLVSSFDTVIALTYGGSATGSGTDYTGPNSVTILAGQTNATITLTVVDDLVVEGSESVAVTLASITSAAPSVTLSATVLATNTIADNDVATLTLGAPVVNEATGTATYPVTLNRATASGFTIAAATSSGTATSGSDFTAASPTLTFVGTLNEVQNISVPITDDVLVEGSEAFNITLSALSNSFGGALTFTAGAQSRPIADNDVSTVSIASISNAAEPATAGTLRLTLTKASASATIVSYTVTGTALSGTDYTSIGPSVVVPANTLTFDISVAPSDDLIVEGAETVIVTLTAATNNVLITASGNATNTIADNDAATVSIANTINGAEAVAPTNGVMTVTQTAVSATNTVLTYTVSGTATAGGDYTALSGSVTILAGSTTATITIPVIDNLVVEPSETVIVTLTAISGLPTLGSPLVATNTISDNDVASFTITKAVNLANVTAPGTLNYTITVASTGNVPLTAPVLTDALSNGSALTLTSGPTLTSGDAAPLGTLDAGETWIYVATYTVTQANINAGASITNSATFDTAETAASTSNAVTTTIAQNPHLTITKSASTNGPSPVGTVITYSYAVLNDGNITMSAVEVDDTHNGSGPLVGPSNEVLTDVAPTTDSPDSSQSGPPDGIWDTLAPGDTATFTATYTVTQHDVDFLQ